MENKGKFNHNKYVRTLELENIEDKRKINQQHAMEINTELLKNKLRINELR